MPIQEAGGRIVDVAPQITVAVSRLLAPQVLLPTQIARSTNNNRWLRRLYGAILEDALECLDGRGLASSTGLHTAPERDRARRRQGAWEWIMSEAETCFSFITLCAVLELNSEAVRTETRR